MNKTPFVTKEQLDEIIKKYNIDSIINQDSKKTKQVKNKKVRKK